MPFDILQNQVCAYYVYVEKDAIVDTNGYPIYALTELVNNGIIVSGNGGSGGGSCGHGSACYNSGNGGNGPNGQSVTYNVAGGNGGNGVHNFYGSSGAGGGGADAVGGTSSTSNPTQANGGNNSGGGGGGAAFCLYCAANGGNGGGYIGIFSNEFINNGVISAAGGNGSGGDNWPGGGGGGGFIYLEITTDNPNYIQLGTISAAGGNAGSVNNGACDTGSAGAGAGGGGGGVVNITVEPGVNIDTSGVDVSGGSGSSTSGCPSGTSGSNGQLVISRLPPAPPPSGCQGPGTEYTEKYGRCIFLNQVTITTPYPDALGGSLQPQSSGPASSQPTTANQLSYEQQSAQWLITCPISPNPVYTAEYFNTSTPQFISGNRCLADSSPLSTTLTINTTVTWGYHQIANSTTVLTATDPGILTVSNLGYLGSTQMMNSTYAISNIYNTESYIFNQPESVSQSGIWTWTLEFANFSKLTNSQISSLSQNNRQFPKQGSSFPFLQYYNNSNNCLYNYTYSESVDFKSISNQKIPIPVNLPHKLPQRIVFSNGTVSQTSNTATAGTGCAQWLFWDGGIYGGSSCSFSPSLVSSSASFYYGNSIQPGGDSCIAGSCQGHTSYVYTANDMVNGVNKYANDYLVATASFEGFDPLNGCDSFFGCLYNYKAYAIPSSELHFSEVAAVPYLLYNFSTPATVSDLNGETRYLNESYDIYSPYNYMNPNALEPFGLHVGSSFFASHHTSDGNSYFVEYPYSEVSFTSNAAFDDPNSNFVSAFNSNQQESETNNANSPLASLLKTPVGLFKSGKIKSPSFAYATPNDYVYLINHTYSSSFGGFSSKTATSFYSIRSIPLGYYNLSNIQPNFAVNSVTADSPYSTNSLWVSAWKTYWADSLAEQSQTFYITNLTEMSSSTSHVCLQWAINFVAECESGAGSELNGFIPTYMTSDYSGDIFLAGLYKTTQTSNHFSHTVTHLELASYFVNGTAIVAKPEQSSDYGFPKAPTNLATTSGGQFLYLSNASYPNIPMFSSNSLTYEQNISLSYSNLTYNLNITSYLAHGGPFGSNAVATAYAGASNSIDISSNHHPIAIFDSGDLLYVVDDWAFSVNGLNSNILMLRVFFPNGTEIPVDGQHYNDLILNASQANLIRLLGGNVSASASNPPYGWPLSANISLPNNKYVSYCIAECEYGPSSDKNYNGYYPIGPFIDLTSYIQPLFSPSLTEFYINYNGTVYMIAHIIRRKSILPVPPTGVYTELLRFVPHVVNYTKIALSSYSPYQCLINISVASPCTENGYISSMYPPIAAAPSPIKFVLGEGSANDYYDAQAVSESLFPGGISSYGSGYSSNKENGINGNSSGTGLSSGLVNNGISSINSPTAAASFIKLTSSINGYALIPYNTSYTVTKSWQLISTDPSGCTNVLPQSGTYTYNGYSVFQVNATPSSYNSVVEGGPTYLKDILSNTFYNANLSDNNSIIPPSTAYDIFTNRLFGSIMLNQSINPSGLATSELINYSRMYNYSLYKVQQSAGGKNYPGYAYSVVELANISVNPPSNIPVYGAANSLISNPKVFSGNNIFTYINDSQISFTNLFQQFTYFRYYDLMSISFPKDRPILGYNRLIYVLQDAFNNTLFAPMDVDIANTTVININVDPIVNVYNSNQTLLNITGTAGEVYGIYSKKFAPLPKGSDIYLYYDTPLNYYNSTESPAVSSQLDNYYTYAEKCAYEANFSVGCSMASPLNQYIQGSTGAVEANTISYNPQYNSSGVCPPPPRHSLLNITVPVDCSINNDTSMVPAGTTVGNIIAVPYNRYCEPEFMNGTGILTSQLGLAAIVTTNSTGGFSTNTITACGTGTSQIIAKYYGASAPEPQIYQQSSISNSVLSFSPNYNAYINYLNFCESLPFSSASTCESEASQYFGIPPSPISTYEYNYSSAPNQTETSFSIGSYYLSMGDISIAFTLLAAAAVLAYQISSRRKRL
ncbi:hypothetical protein M1567_01260 [Candidatus Marsarchaeota archaeon]|nr:hypothetical protein [Candidatus Marsarchaeota archaeon]